MSDGQIKPSPRRDGFVPGIMSFVLWGFLPVYWKFLGAVPALQILAHRIFWSFVFLVILVAVTGRFQQLRQEAKSLAVNRKRRLGVFLAAGFITFNWGLFIWAVNDGRLVETSLGYYINPLVNVLVGVTVLRERLSLWQFLAVILAAVGVVYLTVDYGSLPWVALSLATSMTLYSLCKKVAGLTAITGLLIETTILAPLAALYFILIYSQGQGYPPGLNPTFILLIGAGVTTAVPLLLFAHALNRLSLTVMGIIQYLSPTLTLMLGVVVYGEAFTRPFQVAFGFTWAALILFTTARLPFMVKLENGLLKFLRPRP